MVRIAITRTSVDLLQVPTDTMSYLPIAQLLLEANDQSRLLLGPLALLPAGVEDVKPPLPQLLGSARSAVGLGDSGPADRLALPLPLLLGDDGAEALVFGGEPRRMLLPRHRRCGCLLLRRRLGRLGGGRDGGSRGGGTTPTYRCAASNASTDAAASNAWIRHVAALLCHLVASGDQCVVDIRPSAKWYRASFW